MNKYLIEIISADIYADGWATDLYEVLSYQKFFEVEAPKGLTEDELKEYLILETEIYEDIASSAEITTPDWTEVWVEDFDLVILVEVDLDTEVDLPLFSIGDSVEVHYTTPPIKGVISKIHLDYDENPPFQISYTVKFSNGALDDFYEKWISKA